MKKLAIISAIAISGLFYNSANAQFGLHIGIRLFPHRVYVPRPVVVVQPQEPVYQEPVVSDDDSNNDDCDFYYLPDVGAYYSVNDQCYYYQDGDNWISAAYLPGVYHDFDWRYARRYEIRQPRPYLHNDFYRNRYQGFDRNIARYHDDFRMGFDYRHNSYAYNNDHRFDNRGGFGQHFDNNDRRFDNRGGYDQHFDNRGQDSRFNQGNQFRDRNNYNNGRQNDQNQYRDNQRVAQNNNGFGGRDRNSRNRF